MPRASPPDATVPRFTRTKRRLGKGRGFSVDELAQASLQASQARSLGIRVDQRRRTVHPQNVAALRAFLDANTARSPAETVTDGSKSEGESVQAEKTSRRRRRAKPAEKQAS